MLLRVTVPLLETSSTSATQLRPRLSLFKRVLLKHSIRAYSPAKDNPIHGQGIVSDRFKPPREYKWNDARPRERSPNVKIKLLTPYDLALRVEALCQDGKLLEAISTVKEAPLDAQNVIVWATLMRSVIGVGKYQEAYRLFIDMKRRGISPIMRTFSTLLKGYVKIDEWEKFSLQMDNVCNIYEQIKRYQGPDLSNIPYNLLIVIFGKAQRFQRMFDVFNAMPSEGPLAPDIHTFTVLITAIGNRQLSAFSAQSADDEGGETSQLTANELAYKNASDAKLIWRQLLRVCKTPDSHAIRAILKPLSRGRPSDQKFALDIARDYLGLSQPGEESIPAKLPLHEQTLEAVLITSSLARRYRSTLHYIQQVIDSDRYPLLSRKHMDCAMQAHAALACMDPGESGQALETLQWMLRMQALPQAPGPDGGIGSQITPAMSTYEAVALACWNGGDWPSACRAFELMTGLSMDEFRDDVPTRPLINASNQGLRPSAMFMSSFIKAAAKTYDLEDVRLTLNILQYYGLDTILESFPNPDHVSRDGSRRASKQLSHASKLFEALRFVLPRMLESPSYNKETKTRWNDMLRHSREE